MKCAHVKSGSKDIKLYRSVTGMSLRATGRGVKSRVTSTLCESRFDFHFETILSLVRIRVSPYMGLREKKLT